MQTHPWHILFGFCAGLIVAPFLTEAFDIPVGIYRLPATGTFAILFSVYMARWR